MKKNKRVEEEYTYWNDIAKSKEINIHISDKEVTVQKCLDAIIPELGKPQEILEIGSGIGRLTIPIAQHFKKADVCGADISEEMVKIARKNAFKKNADNICFIQVDGRHLNIQHKVGAVYSMTTFQHIDEDGIKQYFKEIAKILRKNGIFRFQFVEGDEHSRFSQQYHLGFITELLEKNNMKICKVDKNLIYNSWIWITSQKI